MRFNHCIFHCLEESRGTIGLDQMLTMKSRSILINSTRGGIVDERALVEVLKNKYRPRAALDVFEKEPYTGPLKEFNERLFTPPIWARAIDCRARMEMEAADEVLRIFKNRALFGEGSVAEYGKD
jgi:D-3-phosphoglycerate dehydrogenase / 2-oxoglutarate reductase